MNELIEKAAVILTGLGAVNWGLAKFINVDLLGYIPQGIFTTVVVAAIAASGAFVLYKLYQKKI